MAKKYLHMGFTRSRRYWNHSSGKKWEKVPEENICHYSGLPSVSSYSKDKTKHYLEGFFEGDWKIDTYWDEAEGKEE